MAYDPKFGPLAQTPTQRTAVLEQMRAANPGRYLKVTVYEQQLYARYIVGELSWEEVAVLKEAQ